MTASTIITTGSTITLAQNASVPNRFVEIGCDQADSMYFDFHSKDSALPDYSTRIISLGGATTGTGNLNMYASTIGLMGTAGVGIGTTLPSSALQVASGLTSDLGALKTAYSDTGLTSASLVANVNGTRTGPTGGVYTFTTSGTNGSLTASVANIPSGSNITVSITCNITAGSGYASFFNGTNSYATPTLTSSMQTFTFQFVAGTQLLCTIVSATGTVFNWNAFSVQRLDTNATGYVGIGATAPSVPLQIGTTSNNIYPNYTSTGAGSIIYSSYATIPSFSGSTSYSGNLTVFSTAAYGRNSGGSIALGGLMYNFGGGNYVNSFARLSGVQSNTTDTFDGDMVLESSNNGTMYERMRIKTNGLVGIGTTNPATTLDTAGIIRATTGFGSNSGSVTGLTTSGSVIHTYRGGFAILTVSGSANIYYVGFIQCIFNLTSLTITTLSSSGITASVNSGTLAVTIAVTGSTANVGWNIMYLSAPGWNGSSFTGGF